MSERPEEFTRAVVASYNGQRGSPVWIIYKDAVYDVTKYINEHPGGDVILEEAGGDATKAFEDVGHSSDAKRILSKFKIGELVQDERYYDSNGKKIKRVVASSPDDTTEGARSCLSICTCGLL